MRHARHTCAPAVALCKHDTLQPQERRAPHRTCGILALQQCDVKCKGSRCMARRRCRLKRANVQASVPSQRLMEQRVGGPPALRVGTTRSQASRGGASTQRCGAGAGGSGGRGRGGNTGCQGVPAIDYRSPRRAQVGGHCLGGRKQQDSQNTFSAPHRCTCCRRRLVQCIQKFAIQAFLAGWASRPVHLTALLPTLLPSLKNAPAARFDLVHVWAF